VSAPASGEDAGDDLGAQERAMPTRTATAETFNDLLAEHDIILLDFWADWCGPCHQFSPIFEQASDRHDDVAFAKVNVDEQQELAATFGVRSIPSVVAIRERVVLFNQPGVLPGEAVDEILDRVRELDMEQVRAEVDQPDAPPPA
jgi:thioredoxin 1